MKIGPITIGRTVRAADQPTPRPEPAKGASGTINYKGFLQTDEYNPDLQGQRALAAFDKMQRSDGSVQEAVEHIFAPIKNAIVDVVAPDQATDDELVAAALVRDAFFETLNQPWIEYLDQALDYLTIGFQVFETPYQVVERELSYEVPGEYDVDDQGRRIPRRVTLPKQQWIVWDRFEQRLQTTIQQWHVQAGRLQSVVQRTWTDAETFEEITLEAERLLVLTNRRRGDDFTGRSILRAAYKPWYLKELIEKVEAVSLERWGVGIPIAYPPMSAKDDAAVLNRLEDMLANLRAGESTYIVAPGPKQGAGQNGDEGYAFEILSPSGQPPDFKSAKEYHRAEIKAAVLARFAELGHAQTGARSTGDTQSKVWYDALHAVARYLEDVHEPKIRQLVDFNLTGISRYPKLAFSGIEAKDLAEFADAQSSLVGSGAVKADRSYRAWVREQTDAPPEDEVDDSEPDPTDPMETEPVDQNANSPAEQRRRRNGRTASPDQQQLPVDE